MNIEFETKALEELYTTGSTSDSNYKRLSKDVVKRYIKVVNYLKAARRIEDLFLVKSLHYEKKKAQYRLLFHSSPDETGIIVNALLFKISKHYE